MSNETAPCAGDFCGDCPNPHIVATQKIHFRRQVWHFECNRAVELYAQNSGFVIKCSGLDGPCCVEDGQDVFVGSPEINPIKHFLDTTLGYLKLK